MTVPALRRTTARFWGTAYTIVVLLAGTNVPAPLYRGYEQRFGFSPLVVTLVYAAYVGALVPSLLIAGPLSDAWGRRRTLVPAVALAAAGALVFAFAQDVSWLFAARIVQGISAGAATGALTAALCELEPRGDRPRAAMVASVATMAGLAVGPVVAGVLGEYGPEPMVTPYLAEIALLVPAFWAMAALPAGRQAHPWRPRRPSIPAEMRSAFAVNAAAAFLAFTLVGLFLSLVPTYVLELSGSDNLVLAGSAVVPLIAASTTAQRLAYGRAGPGTRVLGLACVAAGLACLAVGGSGTSSLGLMLAATLLGGAGHGLVFLAGLTEINRLAPHGCHADVVSSYNVAVYLGAGLPVIGAGLLAAQIGLLNGVRLFAAATATLCALFVIVHLVRARRPRHPPKPSAPIEGMS
ncbi:MFS transporter [Pseudonocardia yunnanensis]|uniref:MFS transporter n=1 Tax=Pseudonocardia yunnanensis TaxID=58107 RepID=A0ABW4FAV7_9PSEU